MSHLDHIVRVKDFLSENGVTCPYKQSDLIDCAFKEAMVAWHFSKNPTFVLIDGEQHQIRSQLDRWNSVAPIGYTNIYNGILSFINLTYAALRTNGCIDIHQPYMENEELLKNSQVYKDLVAYLLVEAKNKHE